MTKIAQAKGASLSQLALAWLLTRGQHIVPIPGSRNPRRVAENVAAADLLLTHDDLNAIEDAIGDGPSGASTAEVSTWE